MLKKIRVGAAVVFWAGITLLLLDISGVLNGYLGWMAKVQALPAVLALNVVVIVGLVLLTLLFGRVYCSVICPLGVTQDIISHIGTHGKKAPYKYHKELKWLRYGVWAAFVACLIAGVQVIVSLLAPYGAFGRMVQSIRHPLMPTVIVAAATFIIIAALSLKGGRTYCNSICPVGTTLGLISRFAMFRPMIDSSQCVRCHSCEHKCKAQCIEITKEKVGIDHSRCVACFNCIDSCPKGGLKFRFAWGKHHPEERGDEGSGRRAFLAGTVIAAGALATKGLEAKAQNLQKVDGGLAEVLPKKAPKKEIPVTPPGSASVKDFYRHCIACQLCVSACPNGILKPSTDPERLMQPEICYDNGWCRPECTECSKVCPAGAIKKITREEKTAYHIGTAQVDAQSCLSATGKTHCGKCAMMCPVGAIHMVTVDGNRVPAVNEEVCIGCGACEQYCPVRPISAIRVNGKYQHV